MTKTFNLLMCVLFSSLMYSQWTPTTMKDSKIQGAVKAKSFYNLDIKALKASLLNASESGKGATPVEVKLPTLNGKIERFAVYSAPVVVKSLEDRLDLHSYAGVGLDDPTAYVRFSLAPNDFQSMMLKDGVYQFIDPLDADKTVYGVAEKSNKNTSGKAFVCGTEEPAANKTQLDQLYKAGKTFTNNPADFSRSSDKKYRTMRLAMSVTGEYTTYFGGVTQALTAINATMTRVNFVYERDFALRLILQDFPELIYTNAATDPYSPASTGATGAWSIELQETLTNVIGNTAYDIGHLFGATGGGGNAGCIGCVCINPTTSSPRGKGSGYTSPGVGAPKGDAFDIDYVAHEMGHQLGGNHTFSHKLESTGQNVEPGSGSTIMGYAGITGATDVQPHSDPFFHYNSITQIQNNLNSKTCDIETAITNTPPTITPMSAVTIPKGTAFYLTAKATDAEGDPLTYGWEQSDSADQPISKSNLGTTTKGANFRSLIPTSNPVRYFPKFATVLGGAVSNVDEWESVSMVPRTSNFVVTVRDNNANTAKQQSNAAVQQVITSNNGPFKVSSLTLFNNDSRPLSWDVVGTNAAPFNVSNVKIDYTKDNGATWIVLAASTPNDGSELFDFSSFATGSKIKVRISAIGNVFYTIDEVTIAQSAGCDTTAPKNVKASAITGNSATLSWDYTSGATYLVSYKKTSSPTFILLPVSTNNLTLQNLDLNTSYDVKVAKVCSGTTGTYSAVVSFSTLNPVYCAAGAFSTSFEKIANVTFGTINNNSTSTAGYEDFSSVSTNVQRGSTYTFSANSDVKAPATSEVRVWIDYNNDSFFDNVDELVFVSQKSGPWSGNITIPTNASIGSTRMRVRFQDTAYTSTTEPCGTSTFGQVEDYTVNIGTLAVNDTVAKDKLQIYPNPATDVLNVTVVSAKASYSIYNLVGQLISTGNVTDNKVNVSSLQQGVYLIVVEDKGESNSVKFIKK